MSSTHTEFGFGGDMAENYDRDMGPVMFEPYAVDIVSRLPKTEGLEILELAAGTGRVTRHLLRSMPESASLLATDLNDDMLAIARRDLSDPRLRFELADATALPFADRSFDAVVCQFGAMFFPDKGQGFREARRVLRPGGVFVFNVWGGHDLNPWAGVCHRLLQNLFREDPIQFMNRPFGYHDEAEIGAAVREAGFSDVRCAWVPKEFVAESAEFFARGVVTGSPILDAVRDRSGDVDATAEAVAHAFRSAFGDHPMRSTMSALVITAR